MRIAAIELPVYRRVPLSPARFAKKPGMAVTAMSVRAYGIMDSSA